MYGPFPLSLRSIRSHSSNSRFTASFVDEWSILTKQPTTTPCVCEGREVGDIPIAVCVKIDPTPTEYYARYANTTLRNKLTTPVHTRGRVILDATN